MNQFKTLKHKTLPDTYAYPADMPIELSQVATPMLMPITATMEALQKYYIGHPACEQLADYDLITVNIIPGLTAIDVAAGLFNIHHHDEVTYKIIYVIP